MSENERLSNKFACVKVASGGSSLDIPLPPQLSLPIDELQRRAEELEFSELLDQVQVPQCHLAALHIC